MKKRDRVYIIPTRYGLMYGAGTLICVLYGMVYANNLAYLLSFFLLAIFVIGMHQSNSNLKKLNLEKINFEPIAANSNDVAQIYIKSKSLDGHIKVYVKSKNNSDEFLSNIDQISESSMHVGKINIKTGERGKKSVPKLTVCSRYPFGLFYVWKNFKLNTQYYVYPKPEGSLPLPLQCQIGESVGKNKVHSGDEFEQHKKYQEGSSEKRVDWKAFARGRSKLIKEFKQNSRGDVELNINEINLPREQSLQQLSKWVLYCEKQNFNYSLDLSKFKINSGSGLAHKRRCLKALAEV